MGEHVNVLDIFMLPSFGRKTARVRRTSRGIWAAALLILLLEPSLAGQDLESVPPAPIGETDLDLTPPQSPFTITGYWENDVAILNPFDKSDRDYTNGVAVSFSHQPQWAKALAEHMPFAGQFGPVETGAGYLLGHQMFTPANISARILIPDDRPYAGYFFAGIFWQRADPEQTTLDHFQLDLGMIGPSVRAEDIQKWVHDLSNDPEPRGWSYQLGDELMVQFYLRKKWKMDLASIGSSESSRGIDVQLIPQLGGALGTVHRNLEATAVLWAGVNLPDDFGPGRLADMASATGSHPTDSGLGGYGFVRLTGRAVEHNLFLEGSTFHDSHSVNAEPLVGELQFGLALQYHWKKTSLEVSLSRTCLTDEFDDQNDDHSYGALNLSLTCSF